MKKTVLSIRQPWAWLIVAGHKDIENRGWPTKFRGEFYVHAGKAQPTESDLSVIETLYSVKIDRSALQYGGIIGAAELIDCVESHPSKWFEGEFGFVLRNARPVPFIPCPGRLGFFGI